MLRHLRYTFRSMLRGPVFTITALITLALGTGANTAMFSAMNTLLLRPLPYPAADRIVALHEVSPNQELLGVSLLNLKDWQDQSRSFEAMAGYLPRSFGFRVPGDDAPLSVAHAGQITSAFFDVLGVSPAQGRFFTSAEETRGEKLVVLNDRLRQQLFGADPDFLGKTLLVNEVPYTVIGALPSGFDFPMSGRVPAAFIPIDHAVYGNSRGIRTLGAVARLNPGSSLEAARSEIKGIATRLAGSYSQNKDFRGEVVGLHEELRGKNRRPLLLLTGAGLLLLLIACTNVTNLLTGRFLARGKEIAVRSVLGAGTFQLARQFLVEGAVLSILGSLGGLLVAHGCLLLLPRALPLLGGASPVPDLPLDALSLDTEALVLTLVVAIMTTLLFTLVPSLLARRTDLLSLINQRPGGVRSHMRGVLVAAQVALSTILLLSTGLLMRSFFNVLAADPGFQTEDVLTFGLGIPEQRYDTDRKLIEFHQRLFRELKAVPGVEEAGAAIRLPTAGRFWTRFQFEGAGKPLAEQPVSYIHVLSDGYLKALEIPLLDGRNFNNLDVVGSQRVALVNRAFCKQFLADERAVGQRIELRWFSDDNPRGVPWEIVGVVGDIRQVSMEEEPKVQIYLPMSQFPLDGCSYVLRTERRDPGLQTAMQEAVRRVDGRLEEITVRTLDQVISNSMGNRRLAMSLSALFAGVAALLTAVGIYGVVAYQVGLRRRELVIRMILGAGDRRIMTMVLKQGMVLAVLGIIPGLVGFFFVGRLLAGQLYGLEPLDPVTIVVGAFFLFVLALGASWIPARRVTRTSLQVAAGA
ncbi:MAG: ABC transporter permease [Acidobacteriota bacterium]|nr:ABC transporter permease [Acidobacteriota bacterium]